jgi:hypothetical protein
MSKKRLSCPACKKAAGFYVTEHWPPLYYEVSAAGDVEGGDGDGQRTYTVVCQSCKQDLSTTEVGVLVANLVA